MAWRTVLTVIAVVFVIAIAQMTLGPVGDQTLDSLNESGDYNNSHYDGNDLIGGWMSDWFNMGLFAMFGVMLWGAWRIARREITRGGG